MAQIISIDWGKKRTGIAVTDDLQLIASPLTTIETVKLFDFLKQYFDDNHVEEAIIGQPLQMNGQPSESGVLIEQFVAKFSKQYPDIKVHRVDERFTSKIASQSMVMSGAKKKARQNKGNIDQIAATIMLQDFLLRRSF